MNVDEENGSLRRRKGNNYITIAVDNDSEQLDKDRVIKKDKYDSISKEHETMDTFVSKIGWIIFCIITFAYTVVILFNFATRQWQPQLAMIITPVVNLSKSTEISYISRRTWKDYQEKSIHCVMSTRKDTENWNKTNKFCIGEKCLNISDMFHALETSARSDGEAFSTSICSEIINFIPCACALKDHYDQIQYFLSPKINEYSSITFNATIILNIFTDQHAIHMTVPARLSISYYSWPNYRLETFSADGIEAARWSAIFALFNISQQK